MTDTLYPIFYGTRLVTFDVLRNTFEPSLHPEMARRGFNFILHNGGLFGIGGGVRADGSQPDRPGFAPEGKSFHQRQRFPSGLYYVAWDMVVVNPGYKHRSPSWDQVPEQGRQLAVSYGIHMNVNGEPWHAQPIELDGWDRWFQNGRKDLLANYPITLSLPRPQPPQPPVPPTQPSTTEVIVEFTSRVLSEGHTGADVKFYQRQLNEIAGQGLILDGYFGPKMTQAVKNWQNFFGKDIGLVGDGILGPKTQRSIIEISLQV